MDKRLKFEEAIKRSSRKEMQRWEILTQKDYKGLERYVKKEIVNGTKLH